MPTNPSKQMNNANTPAKHRIKNDKTLPAYVDNSLDNGGNQRPTRSKNRQ